jgi:hypothetical protein
MYCNQSNLGMSNVLESIQHAYARNDNAFIHAISVFVASNMAGVVQLPGWRLLSAELRATILERAALTMDRNCHRRDYGSSSWNDGAFFIGIFKFFNYTFLISFNIVDVSHHQPEPKLEFFHQKETFKPHQMFLKNTGNCRLAFKLVSYFGSGTLGGGRFHHFNSIIVIE